MSHEVETMFAVGETPWHGLGVKLDNPPTTKQAIIDAGLDWEVDTRPLYNEHGQVNAKAREIFRVSDNRVLGVSGPRWTPLQNADAFDVFDPLVESGDLNLHTAGSLREGERIWILSEIMRDPLEIVKNDEVSKFVLLSNGHDGKVAVRFGFTPIRVVCANTLKMAVSSEASKLIRIRHNRFVKENVEGLRDAMDLANEEFETAAEQYRFLASKGCKESDLQKYVRIMFGVKADAKEEDIKTRTKNNMAEVVKLFETGHGNDQPGVTGTWWAAYNGMTQYLNYNKGRNNNNRMDSLWFGPNATLANAALETAVEMASAA